MVDFTDVRPVTDTRNSNNIFRESYGDPDHLKILALRKYNRTDLAILVSVVIVTVLVNKYILTRK